MDGNADGEDGSCLGSEGSRAQSSPGCLVVPEPVLTSVISKSAISVRGSAAADYVLNL